MVLRIVVLWKYIFWNCVTCFFPLLKQPKWICKLVKNYEDIIPLKFTQSAHCKIISFSLHNFSAKLQPLQPQFSVSDKKRHVAISFWSPFLFQNYHRIKVSNLFRIWYSKNSWNRSKWIYYHSYFDLTKNSAKLRIPETSLILPIFQFVWNAL